MRSPFLVLIAAAGLAPLAAQSDLPARFADARAQVLPGEADLEWRRIPWRASLATAVLEADEADRPVLLWAMNGHPLGCT